VRRDGVRGVSEGSGAIGLGIGADFRGRSEGKLFVLVHRVVLVVFALSIVAGSSPRAGGAQSTAPLDLAALALRPGDVGAQDWVHLGAFVQSIGAEAADVAAYRGRGLSEDEVAGRLRAIGWQREYVAVLGLPSEFDASMPSRIVRSYITEYGDAEGAAAGFGYLEDESAVLSASDLPLDRAPGEEAEATRDRGISQGRPFRSLDVTFRTGNLVAGVTMVNYPAAEFAEPGLAEAETLAATLAGRLGTPSAPGTTIGGAVLRIGAPGGSLPTYDDAYFRFASVDVPLADETTQAAAARIATYAGAIDVYQLWQGIDVGTEAGALYGVTLLRFPDANMAAQWVRDLATILDANPFYGDVEPLSVPALGDQTTALSYVPGGGGPGEPHALLISVRTGQDVARVHLVPQGGLAAIPPEALVELVRAQADCLRALGCPESAPVPSSLIAALAAADATPGAVPPEPVGSPSASVATDRAGLSEMTAEDMPPK
jgi:hypothetical protein